MPIINMATGIAIEPHPARSIRKPLMAWVSLPSVVERRLKISARELKSKATPRISSLVSSEIPAPSSKVGVLLARALGAGLADASVPLRNEGRKRPNPDPDLAPALVVAG